jgi:hypothetical protein
MISEEIDVIAITKINDSLQLDVNLFSFLDILLL